VGGELVESPRRHVLQIIPGQIAPLVKPRDRRLLRATLRGWIGLVEALALDWIDNRDLRRTELVAIAMRALAVAVPLAS
jgi:hypothetical protein